MTLTRFEQRINLIPKVIPNLGFTMLFSPITMLGLSIMVKILMIPMTTQMIYRIFILGTVKNLNL